MMMWIDYIFEKWGWKCSVLGATFTAGMAEMQAYLGVAAAALAVLSGLFSSILTLAKLIDWWKNRK